MLVRIRYSHALRLVPGRELVERRVRLREGLLHHVLGVGRVARHPHRGGVELVEVLQRLRLEAGGALGLGLGARAGRLGRRRSAPVAAVELVGMLITYESTGERPSSVGCSVMLSVIIGMSGTTRPPRPYSRRAAQPAAAPRNVATSVTSRSRRSAGPEGRPGRHPVRRGRRPAARRPRRPPSPRGGPPPPRPALPKVSRVPCSTSRGTAGVSSSGGRDRSGRPGRCSGNARQTTAADPGRRGRPAGDPGTGAAAAGGERQPGAAGRRGARAAPRARPRPAGAAPPRPAGRRSARAARSGRR